jgi:hypothetical protein
MEDIRRRDRILFWREAAGALRILLSAILVAFAFMGMREQPLVFAGAVVAIVAAHLAHSWYESQNRRFADPELAAMWNGCQDRLTRFEQALREMGRERAGDLSEMPHTIRSVGQSLYAALRRADMVIEEVQRTEKDLLDAPPVWMAHMKGDPQAVELYRVADRNIHEYRHQYTAVMAGVRRTEAQAAVFMTTVDALRMKILGYRLVGRDPDMNSHEYLTTLAEVRLQLQSIDTALEELDLGFYPRTVHQESGRSSISDSVSS